MICSERLTSIQRPGNVRGGGGGAAGRGLRRPAEYTYCPGPISAQVSLTPSTIWPVTQPTTVTGCPGARELTMAAAVVGAERTLAPPGPTTPCHEPAARAVEVPARTAMMLVAMSPST